MALVTPVDTVPLDQFGRVHFVGIGGAGMSGIARVMLARGVAVSGSDSGSPAMVRELAALGARVHTGHAAENLGAADTVVVSSAIRPDNPELAEAHRRGLRVLHRAAALASLMTGRRATAVAGTHGKTTTTSMITTILRECGADPGYVIGGVLAQTGRGAEDGGGQDLVIEADESDGSFLMLSAQLAVITNVEADHLDNYAGLPEIQAAFEAFARRITPGGTLITCADDAGARAVADASAWLPIRLRSYGAAPSADYRVSGITARGMGSTFTMTAGPFTGPVTITVPGGTMCSTRPPPSPRLRNSAFRPRRPRRHCRPIAARSGGWSPRGRGTGCACWTATRTTRPRSRPIWPRRVISPTAAGSSPSSSRTCSAGRGSSPRTSGPRWASPTRRSSWTSTRRGRIRSRASPAASWPMPSRPAGRATSRTRRRFRR